jgi:transcriptional regulator with XRE-family HTH domain
MAAGITQGELADRARVRRAFISLIERGKANPSLVTIALLAEAMDCGILDLLSPDA